MTRLRYNASLGRGILIMGAALYCITAYADQYLSGDVNGDGDRDVIDIQGVINQALGASDDTPEGDIDGSGGIEPVDILDIQLLTNSALGDGALVQRIIGVVDLTNVPGTNPTILAVSLDGRYEQAAIDPATGSFEIRLDTRIAWVLLVASDVDGQPTIAAIVRYPLGDEFTVTLPLPQLSPGEVLDLGTLAIDGDYATTSTNVLALVAMTTEPIDSSDDDEDGVPDYMHHLIEQVTDAPGVPDDPDIESLSAAIGVCLEQYADELAHPNLTDENHDQIPDFVNALLDCMQPAIVTWLEDQGVVIPPDDVDLNNVPDFIDTIMAHVKHEIRDWLESLGDSQLEDDDDDGIPNEIEDLVCIPGAGSHELDDDDDGLVDCAEDDDDDNVANLFDDEFEDSGDDDGDGIADIDDLDDDNDGVVDYADTAPLDPNTQ